jgi:hypothetical protein
MTAPDSVPRSSSSRPLADRPSHPPLAAALLLIRVVVFLVVISVFAVR